MEIKLILPDDFNRDNSILTMTLVADKKHGSMLEVSTKTVVLTADTVTFTTDTDKQED